MLQDSSREKKGKKKRLYSPSIIPIIRIFFRTVRIPNYEQKLFINVIHIDTGGMKQAWKMKWNAIRSFFFFLAIETYLTSIYGIFRHGASYPDGEFSKRTPGETSKLPIKK